MRTLIHISDLHFGKTESHLESALQLFINERNPDLVVVSGDITQRATPSEFRQAEKFFSALLSPLLIVPGNHDIPLYSVWNRCSRPYANYRKYISPDLEPSYKDKEIYVVGVNTVRAFKMKEGRVSRSQAHRIHESFAHSTAPRINIVLSHHPFNIPEAHYKLPLSRVRHFWRGYEESSIDIFLSGHLHDTLSRYDDMPYKVAVKGGPLLIQAGTAISTRRRREDNGFNVISLEYPSVVVERYAAQKGKSGFVAIRKEHFVRGGAGWVRQSQ